MEVYIKDVMSSEVTTVHSDSTVEQSESTMLSTNRRCVPVIDNLGVCVGVLSHSDILRARSAKMEISSVLVGDIMSRHIISVSPHCSVDDAMQLMIDNGIHHVLVIMNKQAVGIVSIIDIIQVDKARTFNCFDDTESYETAS